MMYTRFALIDKSVSKFCVVGWLLFPELIQLELCKWLINLFRKIWLLISLAFELFLVNSKTFKQLNLPQWRNEAATLTEAECLGCFEDEVCTSSSNNICNPNKAYCFSPSLIHNTELLESSSSSCMNTKDHKDDFSRNDLVLPHQIFCLEIQLNQSQRSQQTDGQNGRPSTAKYIPFIGTQLNEKDDHYRNQCTPTKGNAEIRRWIFQRIALHGRKRQRIVRGYYHHLYVSSGDSCSHHRNSSPPDSVSIRLFARKRWGPIADPNTFANASTGPQDCDRKRWGSVLNLDTVFYSCTGSLKHKRKRWGPVKDLKE